MSATASPQWHEIAPGVRFMRGSIDTDQALRLMEERRQETDRRFNLAERFTKSRRWFGKRKNRTARKGQPG